MDHEDSDRQFGKEGSGQTNHTITTIPEDCLGLHIRNFLRDEDDDLPVLPAVLDQPALAPRLLPPRLGRLWDAAQLDEEEEGDEQHRREVLEIDLFRRVVGELPDRHPLRLRHDAPPPRPTEAAHVARRPSATAKAPRWRRRKCDSPGISRRRRYCTERAEFRTICVTVSPGALALFSLTRGLTRLTDT